MENLEILYFFNYYLILFYIIFSIIIGVILALLSTILNWAPYNKDLEIVSSYECGFLPFDKARNKFEVKFFLIAILFVLFDLEVIFVFPWGIMLEYHTLFVYLLMVFFIVLLTLGFIYELLNDALVF